MAALKDLLAEHTNLSGKNADHLHRLVAEWQLLADLSFADFRLWVRTEKAEHSVICVGQCRPNTAATAYAHDGVGAVATEVDHPQVFRAYVSGRILRDEDPLWWGSIPIHREAIPVRYDGEIIGVLSRDTNLSNPRMPSPLEIAYQSAAADLCQMVTTGTFPDHNEEPHGHSTPRAGDGFVRLDAAGTVVYASPNATSALRRMGWGGEVDGQQFVDVVSHVIADRFEAEDVVRQMRSVIDVDGIGPSPDVRLEIDNKSATVLIRMLSLRPRGQNAGVAVLMRDLTELKRRDRALISKDATIREIHHRVKNNLQSVSALLRLQARRTTNDEARQALNESVRRVASIAIVHDTLSMSVDEQVAVDEVIDQLLPVMSDVAQHGSGLVQLTRRGHIGTFPAQQAMPLVMVLTELVQNAIEHAFAPDQPGSVTIDASRSTKRVTVIVHDNGRGLPADFELASSDRLGLQIVSTLVSAELKGSLEIVPGLGGGTDAVLQVPLYHR